MMTRRLAFVSSAILLAIAVSGCAGGASFGPRGISIGASFAEPMYAEPAAAWAPAPYMPAGPVYALPPAPPVGYGAVEYVEVPSGPAYWSGYRYVTPMVSVRLYRDPYHRGYYYMHGRPYWHRHHR